MGATLERTSQTYRALGQVPVPQDLLQSSSSGAGGRRRWFLRVSNRSSRRRRSTGAASPRASGLSRSVAESYTKLPPCGVQSGAGGGAAMRRTPEFKQSAGRGSSRSCISHGGQERQPKSSRPNHSDPTPFSSAPQQNKQYPNFGARISSYRQS